MDFVAFFSHVGLLASVAVLIVQQILKLNVIPLAFANHYPVPTNIILSIVAAVVAVWKDHVSLHSWTDWVGAVALIAGTAALAYNQLLGKWAQLKAIEGEGKAPAA